MKRLLIVATITLTACTHHPRTLTRLNVTKCDPCKVAWFDMGIERHSFCLDNDAVWIEYAKHKDATLEPCARGHKK